MSIPVPLDELEAQLVAYPWGYLITVSDTQRAHSLAVPTKFVDGVLIADAGRGTRSFAEARPNVTMAFPSPTPGDYSLIVDGDASIDGDAVHVRPTSAVLHRPALPN